MDERKIKMKKRISVLLILCMAIIMMTGCTAFKGTTEPQTNEGKRIITLAPADFEIMYDLGAEDQLVGRSDYCDYPTQGASVESVGECLLPDTEKIIALKPDVVIAEYMLTDQDVLDGLVNAGINVVASPSPNTVEGIYEKINKLAEITGKQEKATEIIDLMKLAMTKHVDEKLSSAQPAPVSVYYVVDTGEYGEYTATGDTFINEIINAAGKMHNVAENATGWTYTAEQLILDDPDYIIGMAEHIQKIRENPQYKNLTAVKVGHAVAFDINILSRPTPRAVLEGIPLLRETLHVDSRLVETIIPTEQSIKN